MIQRLLARRSVVDLNGERHNVDTYEYTHTKIVKRGVLCFRQTVLGTYEEEKGKRKLIGQSVLGEQQVDCPEGMKP